MLMKLSSLLEVLFLFFSFLESTSALNLTTRHGCVGDLQCVKNVCIRSFSGLYFPAFGLNMDQKNPDTDTFHAVLETH